MQFIVEILKVSTTFIGIIVFLTFVFIGVKRMTRLFRLEYQVERLEHLLRAMEQDPKTKNDYLHRLQRIYAELMTLIP